MAEGKQLEKVLKELQTLRETSHEKIFACIEVTSMLNEVFGNYGSFHFNPDFPLAPGCEKVEGTHLQAHINAEITKNKKNYSFGSADAPYLTNTSGNLSKTSLSLLNQRQHVQIAKKDYCAKMIKLHYESKLLEATGFLGYCFEVNQRTYENYELTDIHCTPDGWLRKGKRMIPVEIYDITRAANNKRQAYLKSSGDRASSEDKMPLTADQQNEGETMTVHSGPLLDKRRPLIASDPVPDENLPCYMLPSTKVPIRAERDTGLLTNLTAAQKSVEFADEPVFAKQPNTKFVAVDDAKGFRTAFKTQLSRKYRQCVMQIAITSSTKGLLLFWDQTQCTIYHIIVLRDERFDAVLTSLLSTAPALLRAVFASDSEEESVQEPDGSLKEEPNHSLRSASVSVKSKQIAKLKGHALLQNYREKTEQIAEKSKNSEAEQIATQDNHGNDNPESGSEQGSDRNWAPEKKKGKLRGPYKKRLPKH